MTRTYALVALAAALLSGLGLFWAAGSMPQIAEENALLESSQALCLGASALVAAILALKDRPHRFIWAFYLLFSLSMFLREVDVEDFGLPTLLIVLGSGLGRNILLAVCWLGLLAWFLRDPRARSTGLLRFLWPWYGIIFCAGCLFYAAGLPFDKQCFPLQKQASRLMEELLEFAGALLLLQVPLAGILPLLRPSAPATVQLRDLDVERPEIPEEELDPEERRRAV
ncbi:MAG: hypothetical protein WDA20_11225 [Desulfuromonadales bacterium]